jgi:putative FmdB family regulatory protein
MPTYEYECRVCHHRFEEFQGISEKPIQTCPQCKGKVDRLISGGAGILFKGSGFYATDYRSKDYREKAKAEKPEAKSDTPDAKKEPVKAAADRLKDKGAVD